MNNEQQTPPGAVSASEPGPTPAPPWRVVAAELRRTQIAAWLLFALQTAALLVGAFWPQEPDASVSIRIGLALVLVAGQVAAALKHVIAQFRCAATSTGGRRAAKVSAWAGLAFVGVALAGGFVPHSARTYLTVVLSLLVLISSLTWLTYLRTVARHWGDHELDAAVARFAWWVWVGNACLLYRGLVPEPDPMIAGLFSAVIVLFVIAVYARLASAVATLVAARSPDAVP